MTQRYVLKASDENQSDPAASFHDLLIGCLPRMRQQAFALTRRRADADDLVQAAVVNALAARDSFIPGSNFKAWMSRILRNRFLSDVRRRREMVEMDDAPAESMSRPATQEDSVAMSELQVCVARLPADQRIALMMSAVQGMSYEEMSEELGVAVGTLKCRVFRARKQLQAWLLDEEPTPRIAPAARPAKRTGVSTLASAPGLTL
ncbi:sigma-70 family RNA polymerase sigma factor [Humitalea sp. 24SJ18S-53]|uniref:sigma-70 family RNA polymerase sigma factor n=1 Tax=Humitalea sp. 24SJ18S-53 TaxID=3422307 RepID=UPI003D675E78